MLVDAIPPNLPRISPSFTRQAHITWPSQQHFFSIFTVQITLPYLYYFPTSKLTGFSASWASYYAMLLCMCLWLGNIVFGHWTRSWVDHLLTWWDYLAIISHWLEWWTDNLEVAGLLGYWHDAIVCPPVCLFVMLCLVVLRVDVGVESCPLCNLCS